MEAPAVIVEAYIRACIQVLEAPDETSYNEATSLAENYRPRLSPEQQSAAKTTAQERWRREHGL
jgi:hypothetical protein